jgi:uncharacterized Zn finger protein (UPF0148 family)
MNVIMIQCAECGLEYLTQYKSGKTECPECQHQNTLLVGKEAVDAMLEQERMRR